ncbi:ligase-associated DNA damage response exonuclease [Rhodocytophaga rosea]|uniref:Ligase-associated DNA damage response exonuclease n=1 Tax=Rhodocytophaga rosea TaxID=2704465 RepID=A0A6C0GRS2_9BACT|nr:ligase-associated DNA damage response exonuclease [Rhodocytophaga rosea]QHT70564.1 ligase-associated DNA damage response exonuclease [Rhodocytophaga rosea]
MSLIEFTPQGMYCPQAGMYIDPWQPVDKAIITHAHGDHARRGNKYYLAHVTSEHVLRLRLGEHINLQTIEYNVPIHINGVKISFHPAGHIVGSSQIRLEYQGEIWVASGDYKTEPDLLSQSFEPVRCHTFISESTFGLPVYQWKPQSEIFDEINQWWKDNQNADKVSIVFGYSLGKAQRILQNLDTSLGKIFVHGAIWHTNEALRQDGILLPEVIRVSKEIPNQTYRGGLVLAPPSAMATPWIRKFAPYATASASGWMTLRGAKRRKALDRGFVLSDHADWNGLNAAIEATGAQRVYVTHGYKSAFARYLTEKGLEAYEADTLFEGESLDPLPSLEENELQ